MGKHRKSEVAIPCTARVFMQCLVVLCVVFVSTACVAATASMPYRIQVVDEATSRGIPLVILESSLQTRHVTDSNGVIAFNEPIAMGRDVHFRPTSDGYGFDAPPLAMGGVTLKPQKGSSTTIVMQRDMVAERLYRITGAGIYRDTVAVEEEPPVAEPLLNAGVIGQDSTLCTVYDGKIFWVWGDTSHMRHPLAANFRVTAATSDLPTSGGLPIERGVNLEYFTDGEFVKPMVNMCPGDRSAIYWLSCLMNVPDSQGQERLLAWYSRVDSAMKTLERGIVEYDPQAKEFKPVAQHPTTAPLQPGGHAVRTTGANGEEYILFTNYGEQTRVHATYESAIDPAQYEALTCLENKGEFTTASARVRTNPDGMVTYSWVKGASPTGPAQQRQLLEAKQLQENDCLYRPADSESGKAFIPHSCSVAHSAHRGKWIMITSELMGKSMLGELWYLESERPEGPWINAVKIVTHENYTLYNPLQHPELILNTTEPGADTSRYLYFEGTYTKTFSAAQVAMPWYDYNQLMFRIDLDDERLKMPPSTFAGIVGD